MDKLMLTFLGTVLAFLGAVCLDSSGVQARTPSVFPREEIEQNDPPNDPGWVALGIALLVASALTGVLASLIP